MVRTLQENYLRRDWVDMNHMERKQIEYLKRQKEELLDNFIGACELINQQIKEVRSGTWLKEVTEKENV